MIHVGGIMIHVGGYHEYIGEMFSALRFSI